MDYRDKYVGLWSKECIDSKFYLYHHSREDLDGKEQVYIEELPSRMLPEQVEVTKSGNDGLLIEGLFFHYSHPNDRELWVEDFIAKFDNPLDYKVHGYGVLVCVNSMSGRLETNKITTYETEIGIIVRNIFYKRSSVCVYTKIR